MGVDQERLRFEGEDSALVHVRLPLVLAAVDDRAPDRPISLVSTPKNHCFLSSAVVRAFQTDAGDALIVTEAVLRNPVMGPMVGQVGAGHPG